MKSRQAIGYVVRIDGTEVTINLLDVHRGQLAAHSQGVSSVTEIGCLLGIESGGRLLVMRVMSTSFSEPREAHAYGLTINTMSTEPLRNLGGVVVGQIKREGTQVGFVADSLSSPALGSEVFPLNQSEAASILGRNEGHSAPVRLGDDLRGGGPLIVGLQDLVSRHVAVLGSSGQGKSCLTAAVLQQIAKMPRARIVVFDINGEYADAFPAASYPPGTVKVTQLGGEAANSLRIPYFALGRLGLQRLLLPSDKTQRPALSFALDHLNQVRWFETERGVGLAADPNAILFDDCRPDRATEANNLINALRSNTPPLATHWPPMKALGPLIADSHSLSRLTRAGATGYERNAFNYGNVAPLITRIWRLVDDEMFRDVVDVDGGAGCGGPLSWRSEATALVHRVFGAQQEPWHIHIVEMRRLSHDLMPFVLGSLLELYAYELFRRGQAAKTETLLVLEEAHHYLRPTGTGEEIASSSLAYERLAKEGRKFGLALWLSTQRPSEISPTVLSQCSNWICFRLTSDRDLDAIHAASEWADRRDVKRIAGLPRQNAIAFGGSLQMATLIKAATASPVPRSEDGNFDQWNTISAPP